jgi:hypothetical protein
MNVKTKNTYEAAFYILYGAVFEKVREVVLNGSKAKKKGYTREWTIYLSHVPDWAVDTWRTYNAFGNITQFVDVRRKLKKKIRRDLFTARSSYKEKQQAN